jgi:predicted site-specific integrase-resolvase
MILMRRTAQSQDFLTSARVARILGITKRTLHNWIKAGKIPAPDANPENGYLQWTMVDVEVVRNVLTEEPSDSTGHR